MSESVHGATDASVSSLAVGRGKPDGGGVVGVRDRLSRLLREAPSDAEAIEHDGRWWTWGTLRKCADGLDAVLTEAGVGADGRVGIVLENRPEFVAAVVTVLATGRCVVTLSPLQPAARLAADIDRSDVPVVIGGPEPFGREGVLDAVTATGVAVSLDRRGAVRVVGGTASTGSSTSPGTAVEMLTSGTTGPPKRVRLSVAQLNGSLASGGRVPRSDRLLSRSVSLVATPMVHIGGLWAAISTIYAGRRIVLLAKFAVEPWVRAVEAHQLKAAGLVPAGIRAVLDADVAPARLSSLQVVTAGTSACPPELADRFFRRYGTRVLSIYGATEFAGAVAGWTHPLHERWWDTKAGSVGKPFAGVALRITDDEGRPLSSDEVGRLEVRTAQSPRGPHEWVPTSDLARIDADGFLWILGRADDAIIRGGFKIQPDTVKRVLESHPAVREAAIAGLPDDRLGAVPVAAVEIEANHRRPTVEELVALCRTELTPYEVPKHLLVVDALPRTPSTKVSRVDLLDMIREAIGLGAAT